MFLPRAAPGPSSLEVFLAVPGGHSVAPQGLESPLWILSKGGGGTRQTLCSPLSLTTLS